MSDIVRKSPRWSDLRARMLGYQGNRVLSGYVALITAAGLAVLVLQGRHSSPFSWTFFFWFVFCLGSELLWLETPTGEATDSMASTFNVAVLYLFGAGLSLWIIGLSVLIATRVFQKKDWIHSFFGLGQMVLTAFVAGSVFRLLAGGAGALEHFHTLRGSGGWCSRLRRLLHGQHVPCLGRDRPRTQDAADPDAPKANYVYRNAVLSSGALFALSRCCSSPT